MAIDYATMTTLNDTLMIAYEQSGLENQFNTEAITYNQFPKSKRKPNGMYYEFGVRAARANGGGSRAENTRLPVPVSGKYDKSQIYPKYHYEPIGISGPLYEASKGASASFVDNLADQMESAYKGIIETLNMQCHRDGFGLLATLSADSDALTTSSTTWTITCDNDLGVRYLKPGMLIDFFNGTAVDQSAVASRVYSVDPLNKTAEIEYNDGSYKAVHPNTTFRGYTIATDTVASGSYVVTMGSRGATFATSDTPVEMSGLEAIFDDGTNVSTFQGLAPATYTWWKANVLSNGGQTRELTLDLLLQAIDLGRMQGESKINLIRMGMGQRRKYFGLLGPDVRFVAGELKGGYEHLTFSAGNGAVEILIDPMQQPGKVYMEQKGTVEKFELMGLGFGTLDPGMKQRTGYDSYEQFLKIYTNLGCVQRNGLVLIKDLTEPSLYS